MTLPIPADSRNEAMTMATTRTEELTATEARLVACILAAPTFADAARKARIPIRTAYTIRAKPHVQEAIRTAARAALGDATARLHGLAGKAIERLEGILDDDAAGPAVHTRAALGVLEATRRFREDEVEDRLAKLEAEMEQRAANGRFH